MFACIHVPDFPVEAIVRAEPLLRIVALNESARLLGMELGMTKLQAAMFVGQSKETVSAATSKNKASHPKYSSQAGSKAKRFSAALRQRCLQQEESAHSALLDVAHAFTPRVEDTAGDTLLLDLAGLERLYGAHATMAHELASRVSALGLTANVAVAANPDAAMHAARGFSGTTVIPAGEEGERLGVLPLPVLLDGFEMSREKHSDNEHERKKLHEQILATVERWGVRDFRSLALLPERALAARLGEAGSRLQRFARGAGMRTLALCDPSSHFEEAMELESPVETVESLSFILHRLLEQLCARLEARALAVQELHVRLQLERRIGEDESFSARELADALNGYDNVGEPASFQRNLRLPVAMRDAKVFLKLLQLELVAHQPGAPVTKVWIRAEPAPPRWAQRGLFLPATPEAEKLEITLARIHGIVGERRAGIVRLLDTHRQSGFRMDRFMAATEPEHMGTPTMSDSGKQPLLALRILRPACQLRVSLEAGRPVALTAVAKPGHNGELQGKVVWSAGPWRSSGDWWTNDAKEEAQNQAAPWDREEWDIALAHDVGGMALYRIFRDIESGEWFADGSYD